MPLSIARPAGVVSFLVALSGFGTLEPCASAAPTASDAHTALATRAKAAAEQLSTWVTQHQGQLSLYVGAANAATPLATINADQPLNPASNAKILTLLAALEELGPAWRFYTSLCGRLESGTIETLAITSNGDPTLDRAALLDFAYQLVQRGVERVERILVDQSAFDDKFTPPAFDQQPHEWSTFRAPVSAVAFEGNSVSVVVSPTEPGKPARATAFPPSFIDWVVTAHTRRAKEKSRPIWVDPAATPIGIKLKVTGAISSQSGPITVWRRIDDPRTFAGFALADTLRALGVQLPSPVSIETGSCDKSAELVHRTSPALVNLLHALGKDSDNFTAEMLVKAIGAHATSKPGTTADGLEVIRRVAATIHPLATGTRLVNGSGLFDANRVSAEQLAAILRHARSDPRIGPEFVASLSVAGRDGTLHHRLAKSPEVTIRAKTGTLKQAVSLSGYVESSAGAPYVFSAIINGIEPAGAVRLKLDEFIARLVAAMVPPPT